MRAADLSESTCRDGSYIAIRIIHQYRKIGNGLPGFVADSAENPGGPDSDIQISRLQRFRKIGNRRPTRSNQLSGGAVAKVMPKEETSAVSLNSLVGRVATITLGTASPGKPAQGKVRDEHGLEHYVMIEPDIADAAFEQGSEVLLVRSEGAKFFAIANTHAALSRQN